MYSTSTKYLDSSQKGTPDLDNSYGSLAKVLTGCLVTGFNEMVVEGITPYNETLSRVELKIGHGLEEKQVIEFSTGIQKRVLAVDNNSIIVDGAIALEEGLSLKVAPLGYEIVFISEDEKTVCFKNNSDRNPGILKVMDEIPPNGYPTSWAKYARVVIGLEVDSNGNFVDNIKAPVYSNNPDPELGSPGSSGSGNTIYGAAKWFYASKNDAYHRESISPEGSFPRPWKIIGDSETFYLMIYNNLRWVPYIFGSIEGNGLILVATNGYRSASYYTSTYNNYGRNYNSWGNINYSSLGTYFLKNSNYYSNCYGTGLSFYPASENPWTSSDIKVLNPISGKAFTSRYGIYNKEDRLFEGFHRGLEIFYSKDYGHESDYPDKKIITVSDGKNSSADMPLLFDLKNWGE